MHKLFRISKASATTKQLAFGNKRATKLLNDICKAYKSDPNGTNIQNAFHIYNQIDGTKHHLVINELLSLCLQFKRYDQVLLFWDDIQQMDPDHVPHLSLLRCCAHSNSFGIHHLTQILKYIKFTNYQCNTPHQIKMYSMYISKSITTTCKTNQQLKHIHSLINDDSIFIKTALIHAYGRVGNVRDAQKVFDSITNEEKDVVLIGAMMKALMTNGCHKDVLHVYNTFRWLHNDVLHLIAIQTCIDMNDHKQGHIIYDDILSQYGSFDTLNIKLRTTCIDFFGHFGFIKEAQRRFNAIHDHDKNTVCINTMIKCLANNDCNDEALELYDKYRLFHNDVTHLFALKACINSNNFEKGMRIYSQAKEINTHSVELKTTWITFFGHFGDIQTAIQIFDSIGNQHQTIISVTEMMNAYCKCQMHQQCITLFANIQCMDPKLKPDVMCYANVLKACTASTLYHIGKQIHRDLEHIPSILHDSIIQSSLINFYGKCGKLNTCQQLFDAVHTKDNAICNAMINSFGRNGDANSSKHIYDKYFKGYNDCIADRNTFIYLINACNHSGQVQDAMNIWDTQINDNNIKYDSYLITTLVDCLSRNGDLDSAYDLIQQYEANKACPHANDELMYIGLLSGCRTYDKNELGEKVFNQMKQKNFSDFAMSKSAVLLRNMYGSSMDCHLEQFRQINSEIRERRWDKYKTAGVSEIYVNGTLHTFYAGNQYKDHAEYKMIEERLNDIVSKVKLNGYTPDFSVITRELIGTETEEEIVFTHSEKLAVIFGLCNTEKDYEIVVNKNLRICNDCHRFMKVLSKTVRRDLTISDAHRVHIFSDGKCSCNDYY
eukprot:809252_1